MCVLPSTEVLKFKLLLELISHLLNEIHYMHQCKDKLSKLIWTEGSSLHFVRLHHFPIIRSPLCPRFLSHSWPAKSPMTLCCYAAVLFWENVGQLGWDAVSWVFSLAVVQCGGNKKKKKKKESAQVCIHRSLAVLLCPFVKQTCPVAKM